jgi:adenylate cyclase
MTILERAPPSISPQNIFEALTAAWRALASPPAAPPRIRAAVDLYERQSERIIGWFQLAGVMLFAALYAATYAAFDVHHAIEPVPAALGIYGVFTLWRLRLSYRGGLKQWQRYGSAAIDVGVLMALIWSFPAQYGEPAALYLKAPTLLYVYILIGLRALRLDPALVLFTGGAAIVGWSVLTLIAAFGGAPFTSDYRVYMTSLSLLPGAELEKLGALAAFTSVLALGVGRARALLFRTAKEEAAAADLSKFVGRDAASLIRASRDGVKAGDGETRRAAIMFVDLRGFTPATRGMAPRAVIGLLQEYQSRLLPVIEAGGGSVDKFLGDGILVSFGAARVSTTECADAVKTALAVAEEAGRWREDRMRRGETALDIGIALASGDLVYGAVGFGERLEYTVIGDAVNLAAKLEKHAKIARARIISTSQTLARAEAQGFAAAPLRRLGAVAVDGVGESVDLSVLA